MAENKNSFVLYKDIIHTVKKLPKDKQADLFIVILEYVNDLKPEVEDPFVDLVFEPIKQSLKRDLKKYEKTCERNAKNGKKGGRPPKEEEPKKPTGLNGNPTDSVKPKKADSDSDSDSEINSINTIYRKKEFLEDWNDKRKEHLKKPSFLNSLTPEDISNLKELSEEYSREDFQNALVGLFKQKKLPNDNSAMQSNPSHFLKFFNSYLTAYHDKNTSLYGKEKEQLV